MAISCLLEKHSWCILLAPITALAYVSAKTVTTFAGALLSPASMTVTGSGVVGVPEGAPQRSASADAILARNPFDHTTGSLNSRYGSEAASDTFVLGGPMSAPLCEGVVVRAISASADPDWSFAVLAASSEPKSQLKRRGGDLGGRTVQFVGWDRVWMRSGSGLCQVGFGQTVTSPKPPSTPAADAPGTLDPSIRKGIVRISPTELAVDRATLDKIIESQAELVRARATPESENGKVVGIRLSAIRKDSVLSALGLEDGDRLQTINGFDITIPEKALEAYARLRQADKLSVTVNRRGRDTTMDYTVR
jgi:general secretion pathway protein C